MGTFAAGNQGENAKPGPVDAYIDVQAQMDALWTEHRGMLLERLDMLERECWRWLRNTEDRAAGMIVRNLAHRLAGVLGTFGMQRGSMLASSIERMTGMPSHAGRGYGKTLYAILGELREIVRARI